MPSLVEMLIVTEAGIWEISNPLHLAVTYNCSTIQSLSGTTIISKGQLVSTGPGFVYGNGLVPYKVW